MKRGLKALLGLGVALSALLGLELALRAAGVAPAYDRADLVRWEPKPGLRSAEQPNPAVGGAFRVSTNADALRCPHARAAGVRVWLAGDSTVFGWGVDDADTLPAQLERTLSGTPGLRAIQVINGGQPSASSVDASALAMRLAPEYGVDLLALFVPYHDDFPTLLTDREWREGGGGLRRTLATDLRLFGAAMRLFRPSGLALTTRVLPEERSAALRELETLNIPLVVGLLPTPSTLGLPGEANRGAGDRSWLAEACRPPTCTPLDLSRPEGVDPASLVFPADTGHFTAEGNRALAERLAAALTPILAEIPAVRLP